MVEIEIFQLSGWVESSAHLIFIAFAVVYFIAPALGYDPARRTGLLFALCFWIVFAGLSLALMVVRWNDMVNRGNPEHNITPGVYLYSFAIAKMVIMLAAMISFLRFG